jgi:hypothetical protein
MSTIQIIGEAAAIASAAGTAVVLSVRVLIAERRSAQVRDRILQHVNHSS